MFWDGMAIIGIVFTGCCVIFCFTMLCDFIRDRIGALAIATTACFAVSANAQHAVCHVPAATYHAPAQQVVSHYPAPYPLVAFYPIAGAGYVAPPTQAQVLATDELKELRTAMAEQAKALVALADAVAKLKVK